MRPVLERQDNPWEEVLLLNPSRKSRKGGRTVAKKRSRKGRRHGRKGRRTVKIPVTVQGGGLLATGRRRRIKGIKVVGRSALGRFTKRHRKGGRRRGGRKGRRSARRVKHGVSGMAWQRAHRKTLLKRGRRLSRAGKLKEVSNKTAGFEYLDNPKGGRRMARRRRRRGGRRRSRRHSKVAVRRHRRGGGRRRSRRSHRRGGRRRHRRSYRRDNPRKSRKGGRRKHGRRRHHSFSLLAVRRSNPLSAIKSFPFKEALKNGAIAGGGLLATRYLLGSKSPLPASVLSYVGAPGTMQNVAVKNGLLFGIGLLTYSFTKFKPAGLAMATVAVANAVGEIAAQQFPTAGLGDLGLTYSTFEALPMGTAAQPRSLFQGLSSDLIYGSAQPYGLAGGMGDSNFVVDSAMPYGSGMEGAEDEVYS